MGTQVYGGAQSPPQHDWSRPPHARHVVPPGVHSAQGAGHPMPGQHVAPMRPHAPLMQPPFMHVPRDASPHESPAPTQDPSTQQPPASHVSPLQHVSPAAPHDSQTSGAPPIGTHAVPGAVQKSGPLRGQHSSPAPPHVKPPLVQWPIMHVVTMPQSVPAARQTPEKQHPSAAQVLSPQQG